MSAPKLKPCPLCSSTNIRMLEPELLDTDAWNCAIECLDCQVHIGPSYCEPDPVTARYSAQIDWNRRPSAKNHADEREQFLMANLLAALEVALGDVAALAIVDRVRQATDRIYPTSNLSPVPQAWLDVQAERRRQITVEGFDTSNDDASAVAASSSSKAGFSQCVRWYVTLPAGRTSRLKQPSRPTSNYTIRR
ncbi:Lar family restriction alleviation protein [Pseudomonas aeruginosa]|uniref:Lar family restriction alleviation protein n=1 Tax=Pseudomonas aeruginosa TaxID=287 RepID=UPI001ED98E4F|nr:Lar family restriction alleviation protein [Pseudomonas aeruginosa]